MAADEEDVDAVLAGDDDRFAGIVERWQKPLVHLAYRFVRDHRIAEEMAQEVFLLCFRRLRQWRRDAQFSTWLFALALNVYRSHLRRFRPEEVGEEAMETLTVDATQDEERLRDAVRRAVAHLPQKYREALILYHFEDAGVPEAAAILGVPEGTIKARLSRGRALLKERLRAWRS